MKEIDLPPMGAQSPEIEVLLGALLASTRDWRQNLGDVSDEAVRWQPYVNGPSIGGLILHMARCEVYWVQEIAGGLTVDATRPEIVYDNTVDQYVPHWPTPPEKPFAWYLELQDARRADVCASIIAHPDPMSWHLRGDGPRFTYQSILARVLAHDSYTGGQAVLLHETWKQLKG